MASKNKVDVTIKGNKNVGAFAGRSIGNSSRDESGNEVKAVIEGNDNQATIAGSDIERSSQIDDALSELAGLLTDVLKKKDEKEYIQELIGQLKEQTAKSEPERSKPKIQGILNTLSSYVGFVGLAVTQAERIKVVYEQIAAFFR
jgi:hypothetical protein